MLYHMQLVRWEDNRAIAALVLLFEFAQLSLFIVDPVFGWDIDWSGGAWHWVRRMQLQNPVAELGYSAWVAVFYVAACLLVSMLVAAVYATLRSKAFKMPAPPVRFLRLLGAALLGAFNLSVLSIFLTALACNVRPRPLPGAPPAPRRTNPSPSSPPRSGVCEALRSGSCTCFQATNAWTPATSSTAPSRCSWRRCGSTSACTTPSPPLAPAPAPAARSPRQTAARRCPPSTPGPPWPPPSTASHPAGSSSC